MHIVLHLQTGNAEDMAHIIRGGKADGQIVGGLVLSEVFFFYQGFGKIKGEIIADRLNVSKV